MPALFHHRRARRGWKAFALVLLLHALPPTGWPGLDAAPWVGEARADDDDGDDSDDDGGGAAASAGASADAADAGGQDTDPGPREPELPVQADSFVADELIAVNPSAAALQRVRQWGARVVDSSEQAGLAMRVVRLRLPPGIDARSALAVADERDPGVFDLHHLYQLAQAAPVGEACEGVSCEPMRRMDWPAASGQCGRDQTIGMVDSDVMVDMPALRGADVRVRRFAGDTPAPADAAHGTAVATILVGQPGSGLPGLLPRARLRAAVPFFRLPSGTLSADAVGLVKSLDWLVSERAQVIGMSLTGPPNRVLEAAIQRAQARGVLVAAAVGNAGRHAPPAHPAALDGVLGATALSADRRIYWRASQGDAVDFALPGVELPVSDADGAVRPRSGTSYAVPYLVAQLSQSLHEGVLTRADWQGGRGVPVTDLGVAGRDPVFGWGLPRAPVRCG